MKFEWNTSKNQVNIRKHGVRFETAQRIFEGPVLTWLDDRKDYGEDRYISVGKVESVALVVVAHTSSGRPHSADLRPSGVPQGKAGLS